MFFDRIGNDTVTLDCQGTLSNGSQQGICGENFVSSTAF